MTPATTAENTARNADINKPPTSNGPTEEANNNGEGHRLRPEDEITPEQAKAEGLPEQKHAGKVGYGPEYASKTRATMSDKTQGLKEVVKGKLKKDPELVKKGNDRRTGELKKHEHEEADKQTVGGAPAETKSEKASEPASQDQNSHQTKNKPVPPNQGDVPVEGNQATASNAGASHGPSKVEGLGGGKSDEVDLTAGKARLTADPKGSQAKDGEVQRAAEI